MGTTVRAEALITAQNRLRPGLASAAAELERFRRTQAAAAARLGGMNLLGNLQGVLAGAGAGFGAMRAARSAISLERSMYDVQRATDASGESLKRYEDEVLNLARATGKTKEELAGMLAAAGFAGRPKDELLRFTEYASKATVAWGTNAQETSQALAEIGNIYQANQKRIEEIGDTINTVADNSASKETDLIDILRRAGGTGKTLGIGAENVIAFGASLKELGVRTETAAMGLNALFGRISGDDKGFVEGLQSVGLNARKFKQAVGKDATGAILQMLGALDKLQGTKRIETLEKMFGKEYGDDIGRLVSSLPNLIKLLGVAADKQKALGSVRAGFQLATDKDFNRIDRATQAIDVLMTRMGNGLKVLGGSVAEGINSAVDSLESGTNRIQVMLAYYRERYDQKMKPDEYIDSMTGEIRSRNEPDPVRDWFKGQTSGFGTNTEQAARFARVDRDVEAQRAALESQRRNRAAASSNPGSAVAFDAASGRFFRRDAATDIADHSDEVARRIHQARAAEQRNASIARDAADRSSGRMSNLGQFGSTPLTSVDPKTGRAKVTVAGDFGDVISKAGEVKSTIDALGPAGQAAGNSLASGFSSGLFRMEADAKVAIERIQRQLNSLKAPSLSFSGLNTGPSMNEAR
jgi:TP901 family phage tail tape measure protein